MLEIERKWLVPHFPFKKNATFRKQKITQFYCDGARYRIVTEDGEEDKFIETIKTGHGLVCEEIETEVSRAECADMWHQAGSPRCIVKERWFVPTGYSHHKVELDIFITGEIYAEIEFKTPYEATNFDGAPSWFGDEVTDDRYHTNYEIFKRLNGV